MNRTLLLAVAALAACASSTGPGASYTILVVNQGTAGYLWTANDSAAPASWYAPAMGWDTIAPGGAWCAHVPTTERAVTLTTVANVPGANLFYVGYIDFSSAAAHWTTNGSLNGLGNLAVSPGPAC